MVDAGVALLVQLRFEDVLSAVETRAIADASGVTTGSFFHHFRSREQYAVAVIERWRELWSERVRRLADLAVGAADDRGHAGLRAAAAAEWAALAAPGAADAIQRLLWSVREAPLVEGSARTGRQVLADAYVELSSTVRAHYERGLRGLGREPMPPFTSHDVEVLTTALAEGLQLRAGVDPAAVRPHLYGDAIAGLLLGVTRPRPDRGADDPGVDLSRLERQLGAAPLSGEGEDELSIERWQQIAEAAAHLFADRAPADVRMAEVAAAARVGVSVVQAHFPSVAAVAAAGWVRHVPELQALAGAPLEDGADPILRIEAVLRRYVELAHENRGATEAAIGLALSQAAPGRPALAHDLRLRLPLASMLDPHVEELRRRGRLRRGIEIHRLSRSLVHLTAMQALLFEDESADRIVDEVMTMVFDGALVAPTDA